MRDPLTPCAWCVQRQDLNERLLAQMHEERLMLALLFARAIERREAILLNTRRPK